MRIGMVLLGALALADVARAQNAAALDDLFEAADRGEIAAVAAAARTAPDDDVRTLLAARLAAARDDLGPARPDALRRLAAEGNDPALRRAALSVLSTDAFARGDYAEAERVTLLLEPLVAATGDTEELAELQRLRGVAALLAGQPATRVEGTIAAGSAAARYDRVGLPRIDLAVNGQTQEAVFDTGAALSVLSAETARRLGVTVLDAETEVGNGVQGTVPVRVGIADRLDIAGTTLRNVAFLVIDDAQLSFPQVPGGYDIKAILGLPEMRMLGRLRMEEAGRLAVLPGPGAGGDANMTIAGNAMYVDTEMGGRPVPLLLDTGANRSGLSALFAEANPAVIASLATAQTRQASAGGSREQQVATWRDVPVAVGGRTLTLAEVSIALPGQGPRPRSYGQLGSSLLRRFASYTLDFTAMRLELGAPLN
ncbi:aspartyl protease family protein [Sphingosinicella sp. LHD-64]|uniref:aspartyl protease family protein n=1 Tax=Sphingosinicella sp. LHD-64 TaxID=3072139 RepID=UPI00280CE762|nr:aspartyl protease family protein [Sphingosinicella sp. LHD-64]MDQ8757304.1 aspartyl protease family protein [Sphingosinicella sp. LHD-64]